MPAIRQSPSLPPPMMLPGLIGWYDPFDPSGTGVAPANGASVIDYRNVLGNQVDFNQGTPASRPTIANPGARDKPILQFSGTQFMTAAVSAVTWFNFIRNFTIAGTFALSNASNVNQTILSKGNSTASPNWIVAINRTTATGKLSFFNGTSWVDSVSTYSNLTDENSFSMIWDGSSPAMTMNGSATSISGVMVDVGSSTQPMTLGGQGAVGTVNMITGSIGPIFIYAFPFGGTSKILALNRYISNFRGLNFAV